MPRKVHIVTTSGFRYYDSSIADNRDVALRYVESAGRRGADLVCLPETFLGRENEGAVETLTGATFAGMSELAHKYGLWVVAGSLLLDPESGNKFNNAVVINRSGDVAALYAKVHPTIGECQDRHITPGSEAVVIDTDFGRLGLAICYDIGWPSHWADLARQGAELVVWPSAYDGGFPLQSYAWSHRYYVVSTVLSRAGWGLRHHGHRARLDLRVETRGGDDRRPREGALPRRQPRAKTAADRGRAGRPGGNYRIRPGALLHAREQRPRVAPVTYKKPVRPGDLY